MKNRLKNPLVSTPIEIEKRGNGKKVREPKEGALLPPFPSTPSREVETRMTFLETALETRQKNVRKRGGEKNPSRFQKK
jgi:hypothetical protein